MRKHISAAVVLLLLSATSARADWLLTPYLGLTFFGTVSEPEPTLALDEGIVRAVWMTADEIRACPERHRSPLVMECLEAYLSGARYPLSILTIHDSLFSAPARLRQA